MKNVTRLAALFIGLSSSMGASAAINYQVDPLIKNNIHFSALPFETGVEISARKKSEGKIVVIILDEYANVFLKEILEPGVPLKRDYILNRLDDGEYIIEVTANRHVSQKEVQIHDHQCHML